MPKFGKEYFKQYRLDNHKKLILYNWKRNPKSGGLGLIGDYDSIYKKYMDTHQCNKCNCIFGKKGDGSGIFKCMDHCHKTGTFRNILCNNCNTNNKINNTSGIPNVYYCKHNKSWTYKKQFNGKTHYKYFKSYYQAIIYKWLFETGYTIEF